MPNTKKESVSTLDRSHFHRTAPIWPVDEDGHCTCHLGPSCKRPGKHLGGPEDSPAYAVLCGEGSPAVLVVDIDVKGGVDGFAQAKEWELPDTLEVSTPSGGRHLYFLHPGGTLRNKKLNTAIDVRANPIGQDGHAYVVGPGSPGYAKTSDPCRVVPAEPYRVLADREIAPCPELVRAWLEMGVDTDRAWVEAKPLATTYPGYAYLLERFAEDAKEAEPSRADGEASRAMLAIVRRGVRRYQLRDEDVLDILQREWNPRCTNTDGSPYPWDEADLLRAVENSRARGPGNLLGEEIWIRHRLSSKYGRPEVPKAADEIPHNRRVHNPAHTYEVDTAAQYQGELCKFTPNEVRQHLASTEPWQGVLAYDTLRGIIVAVDPPVRLEAEEDGRGLQDVDGDRIAMWFAVRAGAIVTPEVAFRAARLVAMGNPFNPIREYLEGLPPSDGNAIEELCTVLGQTEEIAKTYVRKTLISAVHRALTPGTKVDTTLVLQGKPGVKKSTFVAALFGEAYTSENLPKLEDAKACGEVLKGRWACEIPELESLFRSDRDTICAFLTRTAETYREAYAKAATKQKRTCILIGTVNKEEIYQDLEGADIRRLWIIETPEIDISRVKGLRDAVWSEAYELAMSGEQHWLTPEEETEHARRASKYRREDPWEERIEDFLTQGPKKEVFRLKDLQQALGLDAMQIGRGDTNRRIKRILEGKGLRHGNGRTATGTQVKGWWRQTAN